MAQLKVREAAIILGVSDDTVRRLVEDGSLKSEKEGTRILIDGESLVQHMQKVAESDERSGIDSSNQSIRNQMKGLVTKITSDKVMSQVEMLCGTYRIVSLISTEAVKDMDLKVGSIAIANMKATNVSLSLERE
ncbi:MAG: excisionase family DNA-binding protein [Actinomycetaceae bacterium]|nr:excisionase family DNA-binding protein [Actinomycetaceae bacterium]